MSSQTDLRALVQEMREALEGVLRVADRKTDEFDRAREAIEKAKPLTFTNAGDSEAQFIADGEHLTCPTCGGSGHVDDTRTEADEAATVNKRKWTGVGELERTGYIPAGSADERESRDEAATVGAVSLNPIGYVDLASWQADWYAGDAFFTDYQDEDTQPIYTQAQLEHAIELAKATHPQDASAHAAAIEALECFEAGIAEGWWEALALEDNRSIRDLWDRRISFAHNVLHEYRAAFPSPPKGGAS